MKLSIKSLQRFIDFGKGVTDEDILLAFNHLGFEVESVSVPGEHLKNFVICKVLEAKRHEGSDRLSACKVSDGTKEFGIICGAPNVRTGMYAVLARVGTIIPANGLVIKEKNLAGFLSQGMMCSAAELCIGKDGDGIIDVPNEPVIGRPYYEYANVGNPIVELSITPNRGDAMSLLGIARELAAKGLGILKGDIINAKIPDAKLDVLIDEKAKSLVSSVTFIKCGNIGALDSEVVESLVDGDYSLNVPAADATNFAAHALGQPMHAYDASKIKGKIQITLASGSEELHPIVGEITKIPQGSIIIRDDEKVLALAGIMGDSRSKVDENTKEIILESAHFDKSAIFIASKATGIKSHSAFLFERSVDTSSANPQLKAASFILEICKQTALAAFVHHSCDASVAIPYQTLDIARRLGKEYTDAEIQNALLAFGFTVNNGIATVPPYRTDISTVDDIAEEVARFYGYDAIPNNPLQPVECTKKDSFFAMRLFLSRGLSECITYSFAPLKYAKFTSESDPIALKNPISPEFAFMRASLLGTLILNLEQNYSYGVRDLSIFEIGTTFVGDKENTELGILRTGNIASKSILSEADVVDIFTVKSDLVEFIEKFFGIREESLMFEKFEHAFLHTHKSFKILLGKNQVGTIAQLHPTFCDDIMQPVFIASVNFSAMPQKKTKGTAKLGYVDYKLMDITRDLSIIVDESITFAQISGAIKKSNLPDFVKCASVDLYRGSSVGEGKKSIMLNVTFKQKEMLTKEVIEEAISKIEATCKDNLNALIRAI